MIPELPASKQLKILSLCLLLYGAYILGNGVDNLVRNYFWPALSDNSNRPILWSFAVVSILNIAARIILIVYGLKWLKQESARGWWLSGALAASVVVGTVLTLLQLSLVSAVRDSILRNLFISNSLLLVASVALLWYLGRDSVMQTLKVGSAQKGVKFGKVFGLGLLLFVAFLIVSIIGSYANVLIME